jgi:hypothetical protein
VGRKGFEPSTFRLSVERSTKLSYRPCFYDFLGFCFSNINVVSNLYVINYICQKLEYMIYIHIGKSLDFKMVLIILPFSSWFHVSMLLKDLLVLLYYISYIYYIYGITLLCVVFLNYIYFLLFMNLNSEYMLLK